MSRKEKKAGKRASAPVAQAVDRRTNVDRRRNPDRRTEHRGTPDRRQRARRAADRPPPKPSVNPRVRKNMTLLMGAALSVPAVQTWMDGGITVSTAIIRVAVAMAFAFIAVSLLAALIRAYMPSPAPDPGAVGQPELEDAMLVDRQADEPPL